MVSEYIALKTNGAEYVHASTCFLLSSESTADAKQRLASKKLSALIYHIMIVPLSMSRPAPNQSKLHYSSQHNLKKQHTRKSKAEVEGAHTQDQ